MKRPHFFEGVILALVASLTAGLLYSLLASYLPIEPLLKLLISGLTLAYVIYLLTRSKARVGRIACLLLWLATSTVCWLINPSFTVYLVIHIGLIWLIRSLYFYRSLLASLADLSLGVLGLAALLWAMLQTSSIFLAIWCFFLVQALFSIIPKTLKKSTPTASTDNQVHFQLAQQRAESALRSLQSTQ